jgi:MFS family permease
MSVNDSPGSQAVASAGVWERTFDTFKIRNYRWFWIGSFTSFFGMQMQAPAQSWLAFQLTHSALSLGLVSAAWGVPILLFSILSGVLIDRVPKRNLLRAGQIASSLVMLVTGILISTGLIQYWHLLVAAFLNGISSAFTFPTSQALIPEVVPRLKLFNAIALNNAAFNVSRIAGPALAGALIGLTGTASAYYSAVGLTLLAAFSISMLPLVQVAGKLGRSVKRELGEGFGFLRANSIILVLIGMEIVVTILGMPFQNLMPIFSDILHLDAFGYGLMLSMTGLGALLGALSVAAFGHFKGRGKFLLSIGLIYAVSLALFANSTRIGDFLGLDAQVVHLTFVLLALVGGFGTVYIATSNTLIQMQVRDEVRGRVMGVYGIVVGLIPIGVLPAAAVAQTLGAPQAVTILASIMACFMLMMLFFNRRVKKLE